MLSRQEQNNRNWRWKNKSERVFLVLWHMSLFGAFQVEEDLGVFPLWWLGGQTMVSVPQVLPTKIHPELDFPQLPLTSHTIFELPAASHRFVSNTPLMALTANMLQKIENPDHRRAICWKHDVACISRSSCRQGGLCFFLSSVQKI